MPQDPASFRDPAGHVHLRGDKVYRTVLEPGEAHYRALRESGFLELAVDTGRVIAGREVDPALLGDEEARARFLIEHPRLDFISYPYEWSFFGLQQAALLTLDLHLDALDHGLTMSDASAYNIQFIGPRPLFIDHLSLLKYQEGQVWLGYRQFCEQFLNPLLLTAKTGIPFQPYYRGTLEGLRSADLAELLPMRARFDPRIAVHVLLQSRLQHSVTSSRVTYARKIQLSLQGLKNNLRSMRDWVAKIVPRGKVTPWQSYERTAHYTADERSAKARFVADFVEASHAAMVWDLGCNSGEYSEIALRSGARSAIGFEPDDGALNAAFQRAVAKQLAFLPLSMDLANPSPALGWRQRERRGLAERSSADMVLCLALLHHLVLGRNLPLLQVIDWLLSLAPRGIVEFVPKQDPMAQQLLALKPDVAPDYERDNVAALLRSKARIECEEKVTESGRVLYAFARE